MVGGPGDEIGSGCLLLGGLADLAGVLINVGHGGGDVGEGLAKLGGELETFGDGTGGFKDLTVGVATSFWMLTTSSAISWADSAERLESLVSSSARTAKPSAVFSGAGSFDGGIEGEKVSLLGQLLDE